MDVLPAWTRDWKKAERFRTFGTQNVVDWLVVEKARDCLHHFVRDLDIIDRFLNKKEAKNSKEIFILWATNSWFTLKSAKVKLWGKYLSLCYKVWTKVNGLRFGDRPIGSQPGFDGLPVSDSCVRGKLSVAGGRKDASRVDEYGIDGRLTKDSTETDREQDNVNFHDDLLLLSTTHVWISYLNTWSRRKLCFQSIIVAKL